MLSSFCLLVAFQLAGELLARSLHIGIPGPVIGMALLAAWLLFRPGAQPEGLQKTAHHLLSVLGLLFVPAGVGIVANLDLLRIDWLPITAGLFASTLLSLLATAAVMHWLGRAAD